MKYGRFDASSIVKQLCRKNLWMGLAILLSHSIVTVTSMAQSETLRINEFMALNRTTLADEDGEYSDWIEIYNPTSNTVDLQGWSLTDNQGNPQKWQFPQVTLGADSYLVLFASGKNRTVAGQELHTNFRLSGDGEYLALFNSSGTIVTAFDPSFPSQQTDVSYGYLENDYVASTKPTPGAVNQFSEHQLLPEPVFSKKHGFYDTLFNVEITSGLRDAQIYYTTDGSAPDKENGTLYVDPIPITTTTVLRAITVKSDQMTSRVATQTYLFLQDVIRQPNNPPGYPAQWGTYTAIPGIATADYEMDPEITQDPEYKDLMEEALLSLPTLSIVTDKNNLFSRTTDPERGGIYIYTGPPEGGDVPGLGDGWERPASVEFFSRDGSEEFQVDCGIRLQGGHSRRAEKCAKHSFRLVFKSKYGPSRLNFPLLGEDAVTEFNTITLRAGFGNTWNHWKHSERVRYQFIRDVWAKDTQLAMGNPSGHGRYVHLYLNGLYWGIYNPTERIDREYGASYLGGDDLDYDVIKDYTSVVDGDMTAWTNMMNLANAGMSSNTAYQRIQGNNPDGTPNPAYEPYVDLVNLIDYMIINFYGANWDWDHHNWIAVRNRINPDKGFKFFSWDAEHINEEVNANVLSENNTNCPSGLFQRLCQNADFRRLFADRIQLHCFNGGVLTPESARERWMKRAKQIELAVIAESARWGDYRRDVHPYQEGPYVLYTKNDYWLTEQDFLLNDYFPNRTAAFLSQLRQTNLYPRVNAPNFLINGSPMNQNIISAGDILTMTTSTGTIYYTTDSSDPLLSEASQAGEQIVLIAEAADKKVLVPKSNVGTAWRTDLNFDDSGWQLCSGTPGGIGYEKGSGYESLITLDVGDDMHYDGGNPNSSCYVRIQFNASEENLAKFKSMNLEVRYDDGFVAYLNGKKVAEANAPAAPNWNSMATAGHEADAPELFNISDYIGDLVEGNNLLAIQAMNTNSSSSDFIINARLQASFQGATGGKISPSAIVYSEPLTLNQSTHIKARTVSGDDWSALNEVVFIIPEELYNLKITEIHYHPLAQDDIDDRNFEFLELKNIGTSPLDLSGVRFCRGITYSFPVRTVLKSNAFIVLAADRVQFEERYGFAPFDEYDGFLDNAGERIALVNASDDTVISVRYNNRDPWPVSADGEGYSLVPKEPNPSGNQNDPDNWQSSSKIHGSPGADDTSSADTTADEQNSIPVRFQLDQNYPNPFNNATTISYHLPEKADVRLKIFNVVGRKLKTFEYPEQSAGSYNISWHGEDEAGNQVASGLYFYRIEIKSYDRIYTKSKKMLLIK